MSEGERDRESKFYLTREPLILTLLSVLAVVFFSAVSGLSHIYHAQQEVLGQRWFHRGEADLKQQNFQAAVTDLRAALLYSRDSYDYQLSLAEALIGLTRTNEASAYLMNLWEREPENGRVNLDLARIAAQNSQTERTLRYYHNAIYANWPGDQEVQRRDARLELIEFLLRNNANEQAQSELIALAANLADDPVQRARAGDLFFRAQDYEHALAQYRLSLRLDRHNAAAMAGAGTAAFELGRYALAQRYLQTAVTANGNDTQSAERLKTTELVLHMDPFQTRLSATRRDRIVTEDFAVVGQRVKSCPAAAAFAQDWAKLKPRITEPELRRNPDLIENAMELAFNIEHEAAASCGSGTDTDAAILRIAKLHEGN